MMYADINKHTGLNTNMLEQLKQSVADILTTLKGTRVMRRDYGSNLPELIDQPLNDVTRMQVYAVVASDLMDQEPRIQLKQVQLLPATAPYKATLRIEGNVLINGQDHYLNDLEVNL